MNVLDMKNQSASLVLARVWFAPTPAYCAQYGTPAVVRSGTFCAWHQNPGSCAVLVWFDGDAEPRWVNGEHVEVAS